MNRKLYVAIFAFSMIVGVIYLDASAQVVPTAKKVIHVSKKTTKSGVHYTKVGVVKGYRGGRWVTVRSYRGGKWVTRKVWRGSKRVVVGTKKNRKP